jgi:hypothetical protein
MKYNHSYIALLRKLRLLLSSGSPNYRVNILRNVSASTTSLAYPPMHNAAHCLPSKIGLGFRLHQVRLAEVETDFRQKGDSLSSAISTVPGY